MAFHEVRLPDDIERGAVGGPRFKTTVLQLASGFEQRNIDWSQVKGEWDISYGLMSMDDNNQGTYIKLVRDFFYARQGRAHGFRFKDWADFSIGNTAAPASSFQAIGTGDGSNKVFQVFKRYSSGGINYDRVIKKLVAGTTSVLLGGVVQGAGFTIQQDLGTITFTAAPGIGVQVGVACEFDVPVRFDDDHLKMAIEVFSAGSIPGINLVEIRV